MFILFEIESPMTLKYISFNIPQVTLNNLVSTINTLHGILYFMVNCKLYEYINIFYFILMISLCNSYLQMATLIITVVL